MSPVSWGIVKGVSLDTKQTQGCQLLSLSFPVRISPDTKQRHKSVELSQEGGKVDKEQTAEKRIGLYIW